ncbi:MAG: contact-dependent growth inhibition system immunity protein [Gemmatimonadaceae bacterium]|jgi:hypothetical protein|nr:contact-dependent growth inhibition system immunity protein [Gemmatimonadaceae bacterium]
MSASAHDDRSAPPFGADTLARSIAELDGLAVDRGAYEVGRVAWLSRALVSPIGQLGPAELRLLLQHERGVRWVLPLVVARLAREPFTAIDGEPAALLLAALVVPVDTWRAHPATLIRLLACIRSLPPTDVLPPALAERVHDDVTAFLESTDDSAST